MNTIRRCAADDAQLIYGTAYNETLGDQLRVTVIATGQSPQAQQSYEGLTTPSVWRTNRTHAAAKVDAQASNGMDEI